jgi:hypothetical protein
MAAIVLLGALLATGCADHNPPPMYHSALVAVVNEGNYTDHNGSVNYYDEETRQLARHPLGTALGATYQSAAFHNHLLWVVCNGPDKIAAFDAVTGVLTRTEITNGLLSPRFAAFHEHYLLVTNWGEPVADGEWSPGIPKYVYPNSYVAVFDIEDNDHLVRKLPCGYDAEGLIIAHNRLFVATQHGVKVFDLSAPEMPELPAGIAARRFTGNAKHFVTDASGYIWVSFTDGGVLQFDPTTGTALKEHALALDAFTGNIAITRDGRQIVSYATRYDEAFNYQGSSLYLTDLSSGSSRAFGEGFYNYYSVGVSPHTGHIYTADTKFDENSILLVYDESGRKQDTQEAGVGTSRYVFFAGGVSQL